MTFIISIVVIINVIIVTIITIISILVISFVKIVFSPAMMGESAFEFSVNDYSWQLTVTMLMIFFV